MVRIGKQSPRHRFILNPYAEERFAVCPQCDGPTEQRKFPLVIHVDPRNPVSLNKTCCYCPRCDLLIAHQDELEAQLVVLFQKLNPDLIGNDYLVIGTLDPTDWERGRANPLTVQEMMDNLHDFADVLSIQPAGQERPSRKHRRPDRRRRSAPAVQPRQLPPDVAKPSEPVPGRNDPCWCGSGKKYKRCHLRREDG